MKCSLCYREILPHEKYVRIIAEEVSRDEKEDGYDPAYFSSIEDWSIATGMHSTCVRSALRQGKEIPYFKEIKDLGVAKAGEAQQQLRLVEGSSI